MTRTTNERILFGMKAILVAMIVMIFVSIPLLEITDGDPAVLTVFLGIGLGLGLAALGLALLGEWLR